MTQITTPTAMTGPVHFRLAVQRNRAIVCLVAGTLALLFRWLGALEATYTAILALASAAVLSALALRALYKRGLERSWARAADSCWLLFDSVWLTLGVGVTGGASSPWYVWYLVNFSAAAFVAGTRAVVLVASGNIVGYLGLLFWLGDIKGLDNSLYLPLLRIVFLHAGAIFFVIGILDLKRKRRTIKRLKEEESRKVAELRRLTLALDQRTRELSEANLTIQEASRLKGRFLANMSHELRTPLNAIIGFSEILVNQPANTAADRQGGFLQNIYTSGRHLLGLINDILDLSKVEAGEMALYPESFAAGPVVHGVVSVMKGMTEKRRISIVAEVAKDLPPIETDPVRFKQILYNLASNAVKFSPEGSTVTIVARHLPAEASPLRREALELAVTDQGIGIDPKDQQIIFEEFRQADGTASRRHEGTGLGLALVKRFVEMHQGIVDVTSAPGAGSTFSVTLPLRFRRSQASPLPETALGGQTSDQRRRILVVEDDLISYEAISEPLVAAGYLPIRAQHGQEAMNLVRTLEPAAITLDLGLPGPDGWEVLKAIKGDPTTSRIPVIIVSMSDNRELGLTLGADDYFLKPVDRERLVQRLGPLLPLDDRLQSVLLIDDEPPTHALFEEVLVPAGYRLLHASSGPDGLEMAARERPALVILDLMMEGMNGFEIASQLSGDPTTSDIPVMALTAKDLTSDERTLLKGKIAAHMQKGQSHSQLVSRVQELLRRHPA